VAWICFGATRCRSMAHDAVNRPALLNLDMVFLVRYGVSCAPAHNPAGLHGDNGQLCRTTQARRAIAAPTLISSNPSSKPINHTAVTGRAPPKVRFASDSLLEGAGFELRVPLWNVPLASGQMTEKLCADARNIAESSMTL